MIPTAKSAVQHFKLNLILILAVLK